eukprot:TRINITY_DN2218_c0_g1_i5.p3 TRINITY_DN2218_c0_g1~~TRINITY_DN2218_c0_g1_i5.p3  ORF type:complete len:132 (+),score=24.64 TRINITY_DN2218_c0_g1_i5:355-750(+)
MGGPGCWGYIAGPIGGGYISGCFLGRQHGQHMAQHAMQPIASQQAIRPQVSKIPIQQPGPSPPQQQQPSQQAAQPRVSRPHPAQQSPQLSSQLPPMQQSQQPAQQAQRPRVSAAAPSITSAMSVSFLRLFD